MRCGKNSDHGEMPNVSEKFDDLKKKVEKLLRYSHEDRFMVEHGGNPETPGLRESLEQIINIYSEDLENFDGKFVNTKPEIKEKLWPIYSFFYIKLSNPIGTKISDYTILMELVQKLPHWKKVMKNFNQPIGHELANQTGSSPLSFHNFIRFYYTFPDLFDPIIKDKYGKTALEIIYKGDLKPVFGMFKPDGSQLIFDNWIKKEVEKNEIQEKIATLHQKIACHLKIIDMYSSEETYNERKTRWMDDWDPIRASEDVRRLENELVDSKRELRILIGRLEKLRGNNNVVVKLPNEKPFTLIF